MTCQNNYYKGDDLIDIITVNAPTTDLLITISKDEIQIGDLLFVKENPIFPYTISISREQSKTLNYHNPVYRRVYWDNNSIRRTCEGTLTLSVNNQVVKDVNNG